MTIETHGMEFVVDASGVEKGFHDYEAAVQGIFKSLDQFEKKVASTMKGVESAVGNRAALSGFKKSLEGFSNINIDTRAAGKLSALSAAMGGFKAPSATQAANTRKFFTSLEGLPDLSAAFRSIKNLGTLKGAMENFKAPPLSQARNLVQFAKAVDQAAPAFNNLKRISGISGIANELATVSLGLKNLKVPTSSQINNIGQFGLALQHLGRANTGNTGQMLTSLAGISNFRAPSAAQIRNLSSFVNALHQLKPVPNASGIASSINQITAAANRANANLGGFRTNLGSFNPAYGRFNAGTHSARLEMMGLQNAFSGTFQVGSLLRSLLGSLTIGELGRAFFAATQSANQFRASMEVLGMSPLMSSAAWERVRGDANHFGADLATFSEGFSKFAVAAHESGMKIGESFKVYEGFQTVMSTLHLGVEQQQSVGLAIREIMDQGYVSTQRLTRQLGLVLPGALATLQKAWAESGKKGVNFFDALKKKMVDGQWALDKLAEHYKETYGPALAKALESPIQQFNILKNNVMQTMVAIGDAGAKKGFADFIKQISSYIDPTSAKGFAQAIGGGLTTALNKASNALRVIHDNWDSIKGPLSTVVGLMGKWMLLSAALSIGRTILSPLMALRTGLMSFNNTMLGTTSRLPLLTRSFQALAAGTVPLSSSFTRLNSGGVLANAMLNSMSSTSTLASVRFRALQGAIMAPTIAMNGFRVAANAAKGVGSSLMNLVGGPWSALMIAFGIAIGGVASAIADLAMHHAEAQRVIAGAADVWQENATLLGKQATNAALARIGVTDFGGQSAASTAPVKNFAGVVGNLADQLYRAADAARQANIANIQRKISEADQTIATRSNDTPEGMFAKDGHGNSLKRNFQRGTHRLGVYINSFLDNGEDIQNARNDVAQAARSKADLQQLLQKAQGESDEQFAKRTHMVDLYTENNATNPLYKGVGDGSGKKKKGPNPYTEINHVENAIDDLMKRLDAEDPIGKLYDDFTKNITKESKDLLTAGGHKEWLAEVAKGGSTAEAATQSLINMLEKGAGVSGKQLADLQKRYGKGIPEIVAALKEQLDQLHAHEVEAMAKTIEAEHKSIMAARQMIGEFDPATKINDDMVAKIKPLAEQLFKGDPQAFKKFYDPLVDGTKGAGQGIRELSAAMEGASNPASRLNTNLEAMGITGDRLKTITEGLAQGLRYETAMAEESLIVGGKLLRTKKEDLMLMGLSADQQDIMKDLQQEVNDRLSAHLSISATEIAQLKEKLTGYKALANQMQRANDFYQNNGIRTYLNGIQDVGAAINDLDKSALQSLEDQLVSLGTTGKFSFKAIFDTIQQGIVKMAAQGLVSNFTQMIFGKDQLNNGQPSLFGGTIGKMMGGYQAKQTDVWGKTPSTAFYVKNVPGFGGAADTVSSRTGNLLNHPEAGYGQVSVNGVTQGPSSLTNAILGTSPASPMFIRDADKALGGGIQFPNGHSYSYDSGGYITPNGTDSSGGGGGVPGAVGGAASPAAAAGATVANSFKTNMAQMIPMVGMMFAGAFKSPIAQIGVMFLSMMLSQMMASQGAGAAAGGGGGIFGSLAKIGMSIFGGGAPVPGGLEGGIVGSLVNSYRVSPAAFVNAPHYADGTPNTSGGHPAILHDNEAVIPLSRGRKVAVELTGKGSHANGQSIVNNFNVNSPDADSFRKSKQQVMTDMHGAASRAFARNM